VLRLLVVFGHQDLRPGAHGEQPVLFVQPLLQHGLGLGDHLLVEQRQQRGDVDGRVLHEEDDPDPRRGGVVADVQQVFRALDQGDQQIRIPGPDERPVGPGRLGGLQFGR